MIEDAPIQITEREWDRGLWWMVLASGSLHVLLISLLLLVPYPFASRHTELVSYTVDLVAPDKLGGSNSVPGGKSAVSAAPLVAPQPVPNLPPPPEPPKVQVANVPEVKPPAPPPPPPQEAAPPKPPAPPQPQPRAAQAEPQRQPEAKPPPPEAKAKVQEEKPKVAEAVIPDKAKKAEAKPSSPPQPPASPQAVAKAQSKPEAAAAPSPKVPPVASQASPEKAAPSKGTAPDAKQAGARALDDRIAAAVKRVEQQAGVRGGGLGTKTGEQPGGPLAVGPGEGVGGAVLGVEYLMYLNQLQSRLKENWAWAGADDLEAIVRFGILETGEIVDVRITKGSGDASYDASVERAVRAANPLPPPPEAYRKQFSDVEFTFNPKTLQM